MANMRVMRLSHSIVSKSNKIFRQTSIQLSQIHTFEGAGNAIRRLEFFLVLPQKKHLRFGEKAIFWEGITAFSGVFRGRDFTVFFGRVFPAFLKVAVLGFTAALATGIVI